MTQENWIRTKDGLKRDVKDFTDKPLKVGDWVIAILGMSVLVILLGLGNL